MPVTKVRSRWSGGNLIFHESTSLGDAANILTIATTGLTIGNASNESITTALAIRGGSNFITGIDIAGGTTGINFSGTTTYFANWDSAVGAAIANTHEIESHALQHILKVKIGDDIGYIFVFDSVPIGG